MASWQGANVRVSQSKPNSRAETVEATLHRLTGAYSVAMQCVGLFHKEKDEKAAWAARNALERALLGDPWIQACQQQTGAPVRSSGHRQKVSQLTYLALLNYGDLLVAGLGNSHSTSTILDRGVVKCVLGTPLWDDRSETEIVRLAVKSYLDAVAMDASDPTTWLKLACAARRLQEATYERLIRYALERAVSVREQNIPPHAVALQAMAEFRDEKAKSALIFQPPRYESPTTLILQVPRNSWTALGRLLLKTARDSTSTDERLQLNLSPLLVLNSTLLVRVCSFLERTNNLEATCRALSASVLAARTQLNRQRRRESMAATAISSQVTPPAAVRPPPQEEAPKASQKATVSKRVSKRVQSQIITSGKRSQRAYRRQSVEYCLLAATLGCTNSDLAYLSLLKKDLKSFAKPSTSPSAVLTLNQLPPDNEASATAALSLQKFVQNCSMGITPLKCLFQFVAKCSIEIATVVASDPGGSLLVSSCLLDCLNCMARRTRLTQQLVCAFSSGQHQSLASHAELVAIDLLHVELRFQRCEAALTVDGSYDGDANFVSIVVPWLVAEPMPNAALRVRCFWLAANYYLWRARLANSLGESRDAEAEGLRYIEETQQHLPPNGCVLTPHLASPRRKGLHWRELSTATLTAFSQDIQASSIVLLAQEQFLEATSKFTGMDETQPLSETESEQLLGIGTKLLERYDNPADSSTAKHSELVEDFLGVHGDVLLSLNETTQLGGEGNENLVESWFMGLLPIEPISKVGQILYVAESPCILTILVTCILVKDGHETAIARLLANVISAVVQCVENVGSKKAKASGFDSDEDDSLSDSDSEEDQGNNINSFKLQQLASLVPLLTNRLLAMISGLDKESQDNFRNSHIFIWMFDRSLEFVALWLQLAGSNAGEDLAALHAAHLTFEWTCGEDSPAENAVSKVYIRGLMNLIIRQQRALQSSSKTRNKRRSELYRATRKIADLVANACCYFGSVLSAKLTHVDEGTLHRSSLLEGSPDPTAILSQFTESLTWLWTAVTMIKGEEKSVEKYKQPGWNLDQAGRDRLQVPLALAITALCGSGSSTEKISGILDDHNEEGTSLMEFYDSDSSATCWVTGDSNQSSYESKSEELIRVIAQAVSCTAIVFSSVNEREATSFSHAYAYITKFGPLLPLVVARVLNHFSGILFEHIANEAKSKDKVEYPIGTRSIGSLLDTALYKVYRCLHGFTIASSNDTNSASTMPTGQTFVPENIKAASMLFRCLTRAYSNGRKLPPRAALEMVAAALPKPKENSKTKSIHNFLFENKGAASTATTLLDLLSNGYISDRFELDVWERPAEEEAQSEAADVRRGLTNLIAQGQLPKYQDTGDLNESRVSSIQVEEEISRKFHAIVESLCYGNTLNGEEWFRASQCLTMKSDLIADRIGLSSGFSRGDNFNMNSSHAATARNTGLSSLEELQERESRSNEAGWVASLGFDLSVYATSSWSSVSSLEKCASDVGRSLQSRIDLNEDEDLDEDTRTHVVVWNELKKRHETKRYVAWQEAWGGIFISSLREVAARCLQVALVSAHRETHRNHSLISEIMETHGLNLYVGIMGSQVYGFPLKVMTTMKKRKAAQSTLFCLERAINTRKLHEGSDLNEEDHRMWDVRFMIGKCHEKIAKSLSAEKFTDSHTRAYEVNMKLALESYSMAYGHAVSAEKTGDIVAEPGGSAHGVPEAVYRLHATRLKCLVFAVRCRDSERNLAEEEALRLTERHWFSEPDLPEKLLSIRERVWRVLGDVVQAHSKLRSNNSYFHRSVYRHAQALMWAPVFFDPIGNGALGSLGSIPEGWASSISGLDSSKTAASSAVDIINCLFGKRRQQLVGVWLTGDGKSTAFQTINSSIRKYDSLRGKYISAYLECLRVCRLRKEVDTFLKWTLSAARDLPSIFSVVPAEGDPFSIMSSHANECLVRKPSSIASLYFLTEVKRLANATLANVVLQDLSAKEIARTPAYFEEQHKIAYACFLRLNCPPEKLLKFLSWRRRRTSGVSDIVEALTSAYLKTTKENPKSDTLGDWSGESQLSSVLLAALANSKERFPTLTGNYSSFKTKPKTKQTGDEATSEENKRKHEFPLVKKSFEVTVPEGVAEGETFFTSIMVGSTIKKLRLTVPAKGASTLRFTMDVPEEDNESSSPPQKKAKVAD